MLPSRAFRNTGIPPALRSLITPHSSLPSNVAVQLRFRLGVIPGTLPQPSGPSSTSASFSTSSSKSNEVSTKKSTASTSTKSETIPNVSLPAPSGSSSSTASPIAQKSTTTSQALPESMEPRLSLTFTCSVPNCGERSSHQFTKQAYQKGVVLVQCPGCKNRHLIADHLGWFKEATKGGKLVTVEDILREKGEKVQKGVLGSNGDLEYIG